MRWCAYAHNNKKKKILQGVIILGHIYLCQQNYSNEAFFFSFRLKEFNLDVE